MTWLRLATGIAAAGLALGAWAAPSRVAHTPPADGTMGEAVPIEVIVAGVPDGEPLVVLNYRIAGSREYATRRLEALGQSLYAGSIPSGHTSAIELMYYIDVTGPDGAYRTSLGAADQPLRLSLGTPASGAVGGWLSKAALLLAGIGGAALLVWLRERRQRAAVLEQIFWVRTLLPLLHLSGTVLAGELSKLSSRPLPHPVLGFKTFSRQLILRKLNQVRRVDLAELARARDRLLGPEFELPSPEALERQRRTARQVVAVSKQAV